jgi:hypothetical protein
MKILGIVLLVLGIFGVAYGGVSWTHREKVADIGPVQVTHDKHESLPVPPIAGAVCLVVGVTLLLTGRRGVA